MTIFYQFDIQMISSDGNLICLMLWTVMVVVTGDEHYLSAGPWLEYIQISCLGLTLHSGTYQLLLSLLAELYADITCLAVLLAYREAGFFYRII